MEDYILNKVIEQLNNVSPEYIASLRRNIHNYLQIMQLPLLCETKKLNVDSLCSKTKVLLSNSNELIRDRHDIAITLNDYKDSLFLITEMIKQYLVSSFYKDEHINTILYIDTPLLLQDFKRLMDKGNDSITPDLVYNLNVLYKDLEEVDFIFWDKFMQIRSNYDSQKICNIINVRHRKCLGNMFFFEGQLKQIMNTIDLDLWKTMNVKDVNIDLRMEKFHYIGEEYK